MIEKKFGKTIDIHGGGQDLIFPHHENEIAQSKCAHGGANLANYWMHNGYLTVDGEKMSKSLGNYVTVHQLLEEFPGKGEAIRLCLLTAHYRQPVDFSRDGIKQAQKQLDRWYRVTDGAKPTKPSQAVLDALRNDLNTPQAIMELNQLAKDDSKKGELKASAELLGLLQSKNWFKGGVVDSTTRLVRVVDGEFVLTVEDIEGFIVDRAKAKKNKDFAKADSIRDSLNKHGITLLDGPDGTTWEKK